MKKFNKSSLVALFGGVIIGAVIVGTTVIALILPGTITASLTEEFENNLIPSLTNDLGLLAKQVETLLVEKKKNTLEQAGRSFSAYKESYANGLVAQLMPFAETFDIDGIYGAVEHQLEANGDINGIMFRTEENGDWIKVGDTSNAGKVKTYSAKNQTEYAYVEVRVIASTEKLTKARKMEDESFDKLLGSITEMTSQSIEGVGLKSNEIRAHLSSSVAWQIVTTIVIFMAVFAAVILYLFHRLIIRRLSGAVEKMQKVSEGDLTVVVEYSGEDEVSMLLASLKEMVRKMNANISTVSYSTTELASAAEQMSVITEETSRGIQQQQMETDQVATAINQVIATVQEVARSADEAANAAQNADIEALNGQGVVTRTVSSINELADEVSQAAIVIQELEERTESIGAVLDVIKGIAEQTNLLALNAAIEAARAGEQGRGFAVVADEVRTLAARTQDSTTEIESMIAQLQAGAKKAVDVMSAGSEQATQTVDQAQSAGTALQAITSAVALIKDMNIQIASAVEEQANTAEEVNHSILKISEVATKTAAGAEQTSQSGESLARLANNLQGLVAQFKL